MLVGTSTDMWKQYFLNNKSPLDGFYFGGFYTSTVCLAQDLIDSLIIKIHFGREVKFNQKYIGIQPDNCYMKPKSFIMASYITPLLIIVAILPSLAYILNHLTSERNNNFFEYLKIHKIDFKKYIIINRLLDFLISLIPFIPVIICLKYFEIIKLTNPIIIFVYMIAAIFGINCLFFLLAYNLKQQSYGMVVGIMTMTISAVISTVERLYIFNPPSFINSISVFYFLYSYY